MTDEVQTAAIKVTLKAGQGYDAPWITVQGDRPEEVAAKLDALGEATFQAAVNASTALQAIFAAGKGLGATATRAESVREAPAGGSGDTATTPVCVHGARVRRTSKPGARPAWGAWFCPQPQNATDKCDPIWDPKG